MSACPGLIPCATNTPGPTGLTAHEVAQIGSTFGTFFAVLILVLIITVAVGMSLAAYLVTR